MKAAPAKMFLHVFLRMKLTYLLSKQSDVKPKQLHCTYTNKKQKRSSRKLHGVFNVINLYRQFGYMVVWLSTIITYEI